MQTVCIELIEEAARRISAVAHGTPVFTSRHLDRQSGAYVFLKCENFQRIGSFKFRGAYHAVSQLMERRPVNAFVAMSSGNHAQGLALACRLHDVAAHLVMPKPFAQQKRDAVRAYGGKVYEAEDRPDAEGKLREIVGEYRATVVDASNDPLVIAGQGTIMLELIEQVGEFDAIMAPIGGGGLLSGLCIAAHVRRPAMEVFPCEPSGALDSIESVKQNRLVPMTHPVTIADGLRGSLGDQTLPILRKHLTDFFVVREDEIVTAMQYTYERLKLVIEPSSAVALAPLLRCEPRLVGKRVAVVLTGGNVDLSGFWNSLRARVE